MYNLCCHCFNAAHRFETIITSSNRLYALFNIFASHGRNNDNDKVAKNSSVCCRRQRVCAWLFTAKTWLLNLQEFCTTRRTESSKEKKCKTHISQLEQKTGRSGEVVVTVRAFQVYDSRTSYTWAYACLSTSSEMNIWDTKQNIKCWLPRDTLLICGGVLCWQISFILSRSQA